MDHIAVEKDHIFRIYSDLLPIDIHSETAGQKVNDFNIIMKMRQNISRFLVIAVKEAQGKPVCGVTHQTKTLTVKAPARLNATIA